eukprot:TRINITY_DN9693_c0_g1_i1.p1 TRINITY_DN9693_c0_g1~~TRINITY_DN9693_c0_g1_i1.p1  ORF type:complete len:594 (+),score=241.11 TRINITY_DN9693_c0_g1_i1:124-1905(+)
MPTPMPVPEVTHSAALLHHQLEKELAAQKDINHRLSAAYQDLLEEKADAKALKEEVASLTRAAAVSKADLQSARTNYRQSQAEVAALQGRLLKAARDVAALEAHAKHLTQRVGAGVEGELHERVRRAEAAAAALQKQHDQAAAEVAALQDANKGLLRERVAHRQVEESLRSARAELKAATAAPSAKASSGWEILPEPPGDDAAVLRARVEAKHMQNLLEKGEAERAGLAEVNKGLAEKLRRAEAEKQALRDTMQEYRAIAHGETAPAAVPTDAAAPEQAAKDLKFAQGEIRALRGELAKRAEDVDALTAKRDALEARVADLEAANARLEERLVPAVPDERGHGRGGLAPSGKKGITTAETPDDPASPRSPCTPPGLPAPARSAATPPPSGSAYLDVAAAPAEGGWQLLGGKKRGPPKPCWKVDPASPPGRLNVTSASPRALSGKTLSLPAPGQAEEAEAAAAVAPPVPPVPPARRVKKAPPGPPQSPTARTAPPPCFPVRKAEGAPRGDGDQGAPPSPAPWRRAAAAGDGAEHTPVPRSPPSAPPPSRTPDDAAAAPAVRNVMSAPAVDAAGKALLAQLVGAKIQQLKTELKR